MKKNYKAPAFMVISNMADEFCVNGNSIVNELGYVQEEITDDFGDEE